MKKLYIPIITNGMGLTRATWAFCFAHVCLSVLRQYEVTLQQLDYPYPAGAMNVACNDFLASDCDEMVVIDTDVVFEASHLVWLLSHDEPLVFGLYPKKELGLTFPMQGLTTEEFPFADNPLAEGVSPLVEVKRVARGFMRVSRQALCKLAPFIPRYRDAETGIESFEFFNTLPGGHSEDFAFCDLWRSQGGKVLVDQRCVARHEGTAIYPIKGTY